MLAICQSETKPGSQTGWHAQSKMHNPMFCASHKRSVAGRECLKMFYVPAQDSAASAILKNDLAVLVVR